MTFDGIGYKYMNRVVLDGFGWYCMFLDGSEWYWMLLVGIGLY